MALPVTLWFGPEMLYGAAVSLGNLDVAIPSIQARRSWYQLNAALAIGVLLGMSGFWIRICTPTSWLAEHDVTRFAVATLLLAGMAAGAGMLALSASEGPERLPRNLVDVVMLGIALTCFLLYLATINLPSLFKPPASGDEASK